MAKSNEDRCNGQRCMDAGDLAPLVTEFARHLIGVGAYEPDGERL